MREKTLKYLITFHTTTSAMAMERLCKERGAAGRLIPVPREISAGCGMAWMAPIEAKNELTALIEAESLNVEGQYELVL